MILNKWWSILCHRYIGKISCRVLLKSLKLISLHSNTATTKNLTIRIHVYFIHGILLSTHITLSSYDIINLIEYFSQYLTHKNSTKIENFKLAQMKQYPTRTINQRIYGTNIFILCNMGDFLLVNINISWTRSISLLFCVHQDTHSE